jgi:predicted nucleotidyltransferase
VLFGSRARGDAQPDSDFDLLVVAATDLPSPRRNLVARMATRHVGAPMDLFVITPGEYAAMSTWISGVVAESLREGKILYEAA